MIVKNREPTKLTNLCVMGLKCLLQMCDAEPAVFEYTANLPSFNYLGASFIDFSFDFLPYYLKVAQVHKVYYFDREKHCKDALDKLDAFKKKFADFQNQIYKPLQEEIYDKILNNHYYVDQSIQI